MLKEGDIVRDTRTGIDHEFLYNDGGHGKYWAETKCIIDWGYASVPHEYLEKQPEIIWERASWVEADVEGIFKLEEEGVLVKYDSKEQCYKALLHNPDAKIPEYKSFDAAGMDFYTPVNIYIPPRGQVVIDLGVVPQIPPGYYLRLESRSGYSAKLSMERGAGIIDWGYRDPIGVILYNHSDKPINIKKHDRVCQGIVQEYKRAKNTEGKVNRDINRGGGFGSTNAQR